MKFISSRKHGTPVMFRSKTIRIQVTWDIARAGWIAVMPPRASDIVGLLIEREVVMA